MNNSIKNVWLALLVASAICVSARPSRAADDKEYEGVQSNAHLNVLGPLQFGLAPTLEVGGGHFSGLAYFRWLNSGLYARSVLPNNDDAELVFSYGLGLGARYYAKKGLFGFNGGINLEYLHVNVEHDMEQEASITSWAVPQLVLGYRWRFDRWMVGLGAAAGYAVSLSARIDDLSGGTDPVSFEPDDENRPYASAAADLGFFF